MIAHPHVVIGSGPSGVAAASILRAAGVTILDVGHTAARGTPDPSVWLQGITGARAIHPKLGQPAFQHVNSGEWIDLFAHGRPVEAELRGSWAAGGYSNAWGAQLPRYVPADLSGTMAWPVPVQDFTAHYAALEAEIGIAGTVDAMHEELGRSSALLPPLPLGTAADVLMSRAHRLTAVNAALGQPRLAVLTRPHRGRPAHAFSGDEFHAPARDSVYTALQTLQELRADPRVQYLAGQRVLSFEEAEDGVWLTIEDVATRARSRCLVQRVYVACGTVQSTALVARSNGWTGRTFPLLDHAVSLMPVVVPQALVRRAKGPAYPIQLALLPDRTARDEFVSLYDLGSLTLDELCKQLPLPLPYALACAPLARQCVLAAQIWTRSDGSEQHRLKIGAQGQISLHYGQPRRPDFRRLARVLRRLGGFTHPRLASASPPGWGYHHAGTLPMALRPREGQTHLDGRLWNHRRVRVIDASVLPTLPAKNHSLTMMANARRIATEALTCPY